MISNLESLNNVSGASLWLREMALDFAGKYLSQLESGDESMRKIRGHAVEKPLSSTIQKQFWLVRPQKIISYER